MKARPISRNAARAYVGEHHRHLRLPQGWLFGVELLDDADQRLGVACAGRPARLLQDGTTCEITRVCTEGARNACSFAYGVLRRAASALGYTRVVTYTRMDEPGTSLRAAGFIDEGPAGGGRGQSTLTTSRSRRRPLAQAALGLVCGPQRPAEAA